MNICITAQGPGLESRFEPHFARAPFFVFYDTVTGSTDAICNGYIVNDTKIGQNVVKLLSAHAARAVITGRAGDNAQKILAGAGIALHIWGGKGTVREAITAMMAERLKPVQSRAGSKKGRKPPEGS